MRDGKGDCLGNGRVLYEYSIYFSWSKLLAAAIDDLFDAAHNAQVAIGIESALVACMNQAVGEASLVGRWVVCLAMPAISPADNNLSDCASRQQLPRLGEHGDIW